MRVGRSRRSLFLKHILMSISIVVLNRFKISMNVCVCVCVREREREMQMPYASGNELQKTNSDSHLDKVVVMTL